MFQVDPSPVVPAASKARFEHFDDAARCALAHIRQRGGECKIRYAGNGTLLADFWVEAAGQISIAGICEGEQMVNDWISKV